MAPIFLMLAYSELPTKLLFMTIVLAIISFLIYIFMEFFSKNRFRGISLGVFSKMISLNDYIEKFNSELFMDFENIATYNAKNIDYLYKGDAIISEITDFMKSIKSNRDTFNHVMFSFFKPNNSFITSSNDGAVINTDGPTARLRLIMEKLYRDEFHNAFGAWLNYNSIWNFINKDSNTLLDTLVFNYISDDQFVSTQHNVKADYVIYYNKLKAVKLSRGAKKSTELFNQLMFSNDDITALSNMLKRTIKDELMRGLDLSEDKRDAIDKMMFVGPTKNSTNYGNISLDTFEDEYSVLDDKPNVGLNTLSRMGISIDMLNNLKNLNNAISFVDTLTVLSKANYNVSNGMFNSNVNNLHRSVIEAVSQASKKSNIQEKYMLVHNACYTLFNELFYFKYEKEGHNVFLFHKNTETFDESRGKTHAIWRLCHLFFNLHMMNCFKLQVTGAISFMDDNEVFKKEIDFITDAHVSIARLKYLIQDYFIIIQQYNDKQYPDEKDVKDFWEKRVNAFGFVVARTKENRPRNVPDSEYGKAKVNRQRSDDMWEADTDYVLQKNTPLALYLEYLKAIFIQFKHPRIPFFQSIMAYIRYMIPPPNVLLDNFMNQIKGTPAVSSNTGNSIEYDFSFIYNPYYDGLGSGLDKFESLEDSAVRMTSTIDLKTHGDKIVTATEVTNQVINEKRTETITNMDKAQIEADRTSDETVEGEGEGEDKGKGEGKSTLPVRINPRDGKSSKPASTPKYGTRDKFGDSKPSSSSPAPNKKKGGIRG